MKYSILKILLQVTEALLAILAALGLLIMIFAPSTIIPVLLFMVGALSGHFWLSNETDKAWNKENNYFKQD